MSCCQLALWEPIEELTQAPTPASARVRPADLHPVAVYLAGRVGQSPRTPRLALSIAAPLLSSGCRTRRRDKCASRTQG
jgi:hypothetical protein